MAFAQLRHRNELYMQMSIDRRLRIFRMVRNEVPIPTAELKKVLDTFGSEFFRLLSGEDIGDMYLLFDTRNAPRLVDTSAEPQIMAILNDIFRRFRDLAVLLRTPIGVLQMRRLLRNAGLRGEVFYDEAEAMAYLTRGEP